MSGLKKWDIDFWYKTSPSGSRMKTSAFVIFIILFPVTLAFGASFDCTKALTSVERLVCSDEKVSKLDEELAIVYKQALGAVSDKQVLKYQQRTWIRNVRNSCKNTSCLKSKYDERIADLKHSVANAGISSLANKSDKLKSDNKNEIIPGDVSGKYTREVNNERSEIEITVLHNGKVHVTGTSFWGTKQEYGPNIGELDFVSSIKNGHIKYSEKAGKSDCYKLDMTIKNIGLSAKEAGVSENFGLNVSFAGEYNKI